MAQKLTASASLIGSLDQATSMMGRSASLSKSRTVNLKSATVDDAVFADARSLAAGASETLDMQGGLTDLFGRAVAFGAVTSIMVVAAAANTTDLVVGGNGVNAFTGPLAAMTHKLNVQPGGLVLLVTPAGASWPVTGDLLKIANAGDAPAAYDIVITGTTGEEPEEPVALPFPGAVASINVFGDSVTNRVGASDNAHSYTALLAADLGANEINNGISGTILQNALDETNAVKANNGRNRWHSALITGGGAMKVIAYGYNDARYVGSPATLNAANYQATLDRLVVDLLLQGVLPNEIVLVTPWYITDTGLNTGGAGYTGQTRAGFEAYVAACLAVANKYGTYRADAYTHMQNNGGAALIGPDLIHPNDPGHAAIKDCIKAATRMPAAYTLPSPIFVSDSMYGAANAALTARVGEIGAAWAVQTGAAPGSPSAIDAAGRLWSATAAGIYQAKGVPPTPNYTVEADLVWLSTVAGDRVQVAGRMDAAANTFYWFGWDGSVNSWRLFKTVAGVSTQLGANVAGTFTGGTKRIKLTMNGDQISGAVDGVTVVGPITDVSIAAAGFAGVRQATTQSNSTGIHIDNFVATAL